MSVFSAKATPTEKDTSQMRLHEEEIKTRDFCRLWSIIIPNCPSIPPSIERAFYRKDDTLLDADQSE